MHGSKEQAGTATRERDGTLKDIVSQSPRACREENLCSPSRLALDRPPDYNLIHKHCRVVRSAAPLLEEVQTQAELWVCRSGTTPYRPPQERPSGQPTVIFLPMRWQRKPVLAAPLTLTHDQEFYVS